METTPKFPNSQTPTKHFSDYVPKWPINDNGINNDIYDDAKPGIIAIQNRAKA